MPVAGVPGAAPVAAVPVAAIPVAAQATIPGVAGVPAAAPTAIPVAAIPPAPITDFATLVTAVANGTADEVRMQALMAECQCPDMATLANFPDVLAYVIQGLNT